MIYLCGSEGVKVTPFINPSFLITKFLEQTFITDIQILVLTFCQKANFRFFQTETISDLMKMKNFSKKVKTLGNGKITCCKQFLLFPFCFTKTFTTDMLKHCYVWERVDVNYL